jgi:hypothetical protein
MVQRAVNLAGSMIILAAVLVWFLDQASPNKPTDIPPKTAPQSERTSAALNLVQIKLPPPSPPPPQPVSAVNPPAEKPTGIHFRWPSAASERSKLREVLHQCLGARMATLNKAGEIKQIEDDQSLIGFSQFARLVKTPQNAADSAWMRGAAATESVVRLIPASLDQPIFHWLGEKGVSAQPFYLAGDLFLQGGKLMVTHLQLDETAYPQPIVLSQTRHCSSM